MAEDCATPPAVQEQAYISYHLNWPGLLHVPVYIYDSLTCTLYSQRRPLPFHLRHLNSPVNRFVRWSRLVKHVSPSKAQAAGNFLQSLVDSVPLLDSLLNYSRKLNGSKEGVATVVYVPVRTLLAFALLCPLLPGFRTLQEQIFAEYLDVYPESTCLLCGFIRRECVCEAQTKINPARFFGFGVSWQHAEVQTEPEAMPTDAPPPSPIIAPRSSRFCVPHPGGGTFNIMLPAGIQLSPGTKIPLNAIFNGFFPSANSTTVLTREQLVAAGVLLNDGSEVSKGKVATPDAPPSPPPCKPEEVVPETPKVTTRSIYVQTDLALKGFTRKRAKKPNEEVGEYVIKPTAPPKEPDQGEESRGGGEEEETAETSPRKEGPETESSAAAAAADAASEAKEVKKTVFKIWREVEGDSSDEETVSGLLRRKKGEGPQRGGAKDIPMDVSDKAEALEGKEGQGDGSKEGLNNEAGEEQENAKGALQREDMEVSGVDPEQEAGEKQEAMSVSSNQEQKAETGQNPGATPASVNQSQEALPISGADQSLRALPETGQGHEAMAVSEASLTREAMPIAEADQTREAMPETEADKMLETMPSSEACAEASAAVVSEAEPIQDAAVSSGQKQEDDDPQKKKPSDETSPCSSGEPEVPEGTNQDKVEETRNECVCTKCKDTFESAEQLATHLESCEPSDEKPGGKGMEETKASAKEDGEICVSMTSLDLENKSICPAPTKKKFYAKFEYMPTGEMIYKCTFPRCGQCFDTKVMASLHSRIHGLTADSKFLWCSEEGCAYKVPFFRFYDLLRHLKMTHEIGVSQEDNICELCGLRFEEEEEFVSHMDYHYNNRYKCIHCGCMLITWHQVCEHLTQCEDRALSKRSIGCPFCPFVFHKRSTRNLHMHAHTDQGLTCPICRDGQLWENWKNLRKHYQQKHAKLLEGKVSPFRHRLPQKKQRPRCAVCQEEFNNKEPFHQHMISEHDYVPYTLIPCTRCDRAFRTVRSLDWHMKKIHGDEVPCDKCDYIARSKSLLAVHMRSKHVEKQHPCSECNKTFGFYHQLKAHLARHARNLVHPCTVCGEEFTKHADMRRHRAQNHQRPNRRPSSQGVTDDEDDAASNVATEAENLTYHRCELCDYKSLSKTALKIHIGRAHKKPSVSEDPPEDSMEHSYSSISSSHVGYLEDTPPAKEDPPFAVPRTQSKTRGRNLKGRGLKSRVMKRTRTLSREWSPEPITSKLIADRKERYRLKRMQKDREVRVLYLRKHSCARSRTLQDTRDMEMADLDLAEQIEKAQKDDLHPEKKSHSFQTMNDKIPSYRDSFCSQYPYLDHCYFAVKTDAVALQEQLAGPSRGGKRPSLARSTGETPLMAWGSDAALFAEGATSSIVEEPPFVSEFEECQTSPSNGVATPLGGAQRPLSLVGGTKIRIGPYNEIVDRSPLGEKRRKLASVLEDAARPSGSSPRSRGRGRRKTPTSVRVLGSPTGTYRMLDQPMPDMEPSGTELPDFNLPEDLVQEQDLNLLQDILNSIPGSGDLLQSGPPGQVSPMKQPSPLRGHRRPSPSAARSSSAIRTIGRPAPSTPRAVMRPHSLGSPRSGPSPRSLLSPPGTLGVDDVISSSPVIDSAHNTSFEEGIIETSDHLGDIDKIELADADYKLWQLGMSSEVKPDPPKPQEVIDIFITPSGSGQPSVPPTDESPSVKAPSEAPASPPMEPSEAGSATVEN